MGRHKKYITEEERKAAKREATRRWRAAHPDYFKQYRQVNKEKLDEYHADYYQNNKEKLDEYHADYCQNNKEKIAEYQAEYQAKYILTPFGRATNLAGNYNANDKLYNRGECTLTAEWIVQNIFNNPCHYCGETDWHELGCDRINNSLPHTPDNVVPCCWDCNNKRKNTEYNEFMRLIKKVG